MLGLIRNTVVLNTHERFAAVGDPLANAGVYYGT